jgi:5-methylthioadenosine/S-adenosylhomocysteine deaminase
VSSVASQRPTIIRAGWVIPVDEPFSVIRDGAVTIVDGRIEAVGIYDELRRSDADVQQFPGHVLMPGIVNAHTHVAGCVFRGMTEDHPAGFYNLALPMERFFDEEKVRAFSALGVAEVLLSGSTVIQEMYHHAASTAQVVADLGVRAQIAQKTFAIDIGQIAENRWVEIPGEAEWRLAENIRLYDQWNGFEDGRIEVRFGLHAADTCPPELIQQVLAEARPRDAGIHVHAAQSPQEVAHMRELHGMGSIEFLSEHGVLGPGTVVAHAVHVSDSEISLLADTRTAVAHCPAITAKRGRLAPVKRMYERGVRIGWGTDWVSMDPWDVMRQGIVLPRVVNDDMNLLGAREAIWRMTQGAADILGWGDRVGSLAPGKAADMILVDADQPHLSPMYDPTTVLVYNASGRDVTHVMVNGEFVVSDRELLRGDLAAIMDEARSAARDVWRAAGLTELPSSGLRAWPRDAGVI